MCVCALCAVFIPCTVHFPRWLIGRQSFISINVFCFSFFIWCAVNLYSFADVQYWLYACDMILVSRQSFFISIICMNVHSSIHFKKIKESENVVKCFIQFSFAFEDIVWSWNKCRFDASTQTRTWFIFIISTNASRCIQMHLKLCWAGSRTSITIFFPALLLI